MWAISAGWRIVITDSYSADKCKENAKTIFRSASQGETVSGIEYIVKKGKEEKKRNARCKYSNE